MNIKKIVGISAVLIGMLSVPLFSYAQTSGASISPLKFEINSNPGESHSNIVKVFNNSDSTQTMRVSVEDFAPIGETGQVSLVSDGDYTYSLSQWVTVNPIEFVVEPGKFQPVEFKISVPENAEPGGHYASILATISGGEIGGGASVAQKVGSLMLLNVAGDVEESMFVKSMSAVKPDPNNQNQFIEADSFEYGPVIIRTRFENTGTVHLKPRGHIAVTNMFGQEVTELKLEQLNVLPGSVRRVDTDFGEKWMFGKYTATLNAIYGSTNEPLTFTTTFWVMPWKVVAAIGSGVLLFLILLWKGRKRFKTALKVLLKGA